MVKQRCIKMDEITKNMLIHALRDVFRNEKEQGINTETTRELVLRLAYYEGSRLFLTDGEYRKCIQALNGLRTSFIEKGRYPDGIDTILMKFLCAKYKRCTAR